MSNNDRTISADVRVLPFIDGILRESHSRSTLDVINPSNGQLCTTIPEGSQEDVDRAVGSARLAFEDGRWSDAPASLRKKVLNRLADAITSSVKELNELDAVEMGKPIGEKFGSASSAASLFRFYAEAVDKVSGDVFVSDKTSFVTQRRVPRGVVAAVVPWNFPSYNAAIKVAPALAAGNTVILKPSELASRSALRIAQLASEAGLPDGVLNVVPGRGETVGQALAMHGDVNMLTFTGSTEVGKRMLQYAGRSNMKSVMLECGGKSPQIVFDDGVDLEAVADAVARSLVTNQGQICSAGSRLVVQKSIERDLIRKIVERLRRIVVGDACNVDTTFGPLVSAGQCSRVMRYIKDAVENKAVLAAGGKRILEQSGGYFVEPTVLSEVDPSSRIAQEEVFGPVLAVMTFSDSSDAIRIANGTIYGLTAYVWTTNISVGMRMMSGIRSSVRVNAAAPTGEGAGHAYSYEPSSQSGFGVESGIAGMESYLRRQLVWFNYS